MSTLHRITPSQRSALLAVAVLLQLAGPALAREAVPVPVGGGESLFPADNLPSAIRDASSRPSSSHPTPEAALPGRPPRANDRSEPEVPPAFRELLRARFDDLGGDDVLVGDDPDSRNLSMDIASNGDIYIGIQLLSETVLERYEIYRSQDNGMSFTLWGTLGTGVTDAFMDPCLEVVEGTESLCLVAFVFKTPAARSVITMVSSPLDTPEAVFGPGVVVLSDPLITFFHPPFDTDVENYDDFYVYLVAEGWDDTGVDIWFARSIDMGTTFQPGYRIAELAFDDREYRYPDISYGWGGYVHATWHFHSREDEFDDSVRYRRAGEFANGGLAAWTNWVTLTPTSDGYDDGYPSIQAAHASNQVVIAYDRHLGSLLADCRTLASLDQGGSWGPSSFVGGPWFFHDGVHEHPDNGTWYVTGHYSGEAAFWTAPQADLTSWNGPHYIGDRQYSGTLPQSNGVAFNPVKGNRLGMAWTVVEAWPTDASVYFDGEWRRDQGYPDLEPGFPLSLAAPPLSHPAVADVDGNGDLEIVFADTLDKIQVLHHDGASLTGWPMATGVPLTRGPVAIGDLDGDGRPSLVAGSDNGHAYAYGPTGGLLPGWPVEVGVPPLPCFVSIGSFGGADRRLVVCASRNRIVFRNQAGVSPAGALARTLDGPEDFSYPPAIGDIDGDGVVEVVAGAGARVVACDLFSPGWELSVVLPAPLSDAITLGDLDLDGDLEIFCPTQTGTLYVLHHTGAPVSGFPFVTGSTREVLSATLAQCLGGSEPEIAFATRDSTVHLVWADGEEGVGYPVHTGEGWWLAGPPLIGLVTPTSSDLLIGSRDTHCWAWSNFGEVIEGWPKPVGGTVNMGLAMGDLDLDGSSEVVCLQPEALLVMDLHSPPTTPSRTWPMYGHDAQRTGCSDCPEAVPSSIDPAADGSGPALVRLALPTPNPAVDQVRFAFSVPVRAVVSLDLFDLQGRRVRTIYREEAEAGEQSLLWDRAGDRRGRIAAGQYFARLQVEGPGIRETLTRKVLLLD